MSNKRRNFTAKSKVNSSLYTDVSLDSPLGKHILADIAERYPHFTTEAIEQFQPIAGMHSTISVYSSDITDETLAERADIETVVKLDYVVTANGALLFHSPTTVGELQGKTV